jgi:hypothetical protein
MRGTLRAVRRASGGSVAAALAPALLALGAPVAHASLSFGGCFRDRQVESARAPACTELATLGPSMDSIGFPPGDPAQLYVTAEQAGATIFNVETATGELSYGGCVPTNVASACPGSGGKVPVGALSQLAFSANGRYAYSNDSYQLNWFTREPSSGALTPAGCILDSTGHVLFPEDNDCAGNLETGIGLPQSLAISPDGEQLYVASPQTNSIASVDVDPATGALSAGQCVSAGPTVEANRGFPAYTCPLSSPQLSQVYGVTVSPDGSTLYATGLGDGAIVPFARGSGPGHPLTVEPCVSSSAGCAETVPTLARATNAQVSADGRTVTVGSESGVVSLFSRNPATGVLTFAGCLAPAAAQQPSCVQDPAGSGGGGRAYLTPDGQDLYITGTVYRPTDILQVYARSPATGFIGYVGCFDDAANTPPATANGCTPVDGLYGIGELTASPDGRFLYGVSGLYGLPNAGGENTYGAVVWFARTPDGSPTIAPPAPGPIANVPASGAATLPLSCPAGVTAYCDATVTIVPSLASASVAARQTSSVHVARLTIHGRVTVALRLPAALLRAARHHRLRALRVTVTRLNANGTTTTVHRTVRLALARR